LHKCIAHEIRKRQGKDNVAYTTDEGDTFASKQSLTTFGRPSPPTFDGSPAIFDKTLERRSIGLRNMTNSNNMQTLDGHPEVQYSNLHLNGMTPPSTATFLQTNRL